MRPFCPAFGKWSSTFLSTGLQTLLNVSGRSGKVNWFGSCTSGPYVGNSFLAIDFTIASMSSRQTVRIYILFPLNVPPTYKARRAILELSSAALSSANSVNIVIQGLNERAVTRFVFLSCPYSHDISRVAFTLRKLRKV